MKYADVHTHRLDAGPQAIINWPMDSCDTLPAEGAYSVGIHPWDTAEATEADRQALVRAAALPQVVAIGETGLDALRGAPLDRQEQVFLWHVALSEQLGKPLIIHAVKTLQRIIELRQQLRPAQRWIIHGFRGKPQMARALVRAGMDISIGERFNPLSLAEIPADRLHFETDTSQLPIATIRQKALQALDEIKKNRQGPQRGPIQ